MTRPTLVRINTGLYSVTIKGRTYEVERGLNWGATLGKTRPTWDLFEIIDGEREWINDFDTRRDAIDHASCMKGAI